MNGSLDYFEKMARYCKNFERTFFIDPTLAKNVEGITNRFADLLLALVTLNENFDQGQLAGTMDRLVTAIAAMIQRASIKTACRPLLAGI